MDLYSRRQYLMSLRQEYLESGKKGKTKILNEYIKNTGHNRKYIIQSLNDQQLWDNVHRPRKKKKKIYGLEIDAPLALLWKIFDFPCGQRLKPCIERELDRLIEFGEIQISDKIAYQLKEISSATIDRRLKLSRKLYNRRRFSTTKPGSLLKAKIPVRLTEWDTKEIGFLEADLVAHCGSSASGDFINSLSITEIATGWWEGEAIMGKSQRATFAALKAVRLRTPFLWKGLDSDNGSEFINYNLWSYCVQSNVLFTRSRENKKNDNAYVEQKNWTHIRKILGYLRYDSANELSLINDLYRNELSLYKNFFQPVMKLAKKIRIGAKVKRKYEYPKPPFQRLLESEQIDVKTKEALKNVYNNLNPAELKRKIDQKILSLYKLYQNKHKNNTKIYRLKEVVSVRSNVI